jgi:hypothetical protein
MASAGPAVLAAPSEAQATHPSLQSIPVGFLTRLSHMLTCLQGHTLCYPGNVEVKVNLTGYLEKTQKMSPSDVSGDVVQYLFITIVWFLAVRVQGFLERGH